MSKDIAASFEPTAAGGGRGASRQNPVSVLRRLQEPGAVAGDNFAPNQSQARNSRMYNPPKNPQSSNAGGNNNNNNNNNNAGYKGKKKYPSSRDRQNNSNTTTTNGNGNNSGRVSNYGNRRSNNQMPGGMGRNNHNNGHKARPRNSDSNNPVPVAEPGPVYELSNILNDDNEFPSLEIQYSDKAERTKSTGANVNSSINAIQSNNFVPEKTQVSAPSTNIPATNNYEGGYKTGNYKAGGRGSFNGNNNMGRMSYNQNQNQNNKGPVKNNYGRNSYSYRSNNSNNNNNNPNYYHYQTNATSYSINHFEPINNNSNATPITPITPISGGSRVNNSHLINNNSGASSIRFHKSMADRNFAQNNGPNTIDGYRLVPAEQISFVYGLAQEEYEASIHREATKKFVKNDELALFRVLQHQFEYYFCNQNLRTDTYLRSLMDEAGWVPLEKMLNFKKVAALNTSLSLSLRAIRNSNYLELKCANSNDYSIRKRFEPEKWTNAGIVRQDQDPAYAYTYVEQAEGQPLADASQVHQLCLCPSANQEYEMLLQRASPIFAALKGRSPFLTPEYEQTINVPPVYREGALPARPTEYAYNLIDNNEFINGGGVVDTESIYMEQQMNSLNEILKGDGLRQLEESLAELSANPNLYKKAASLADQLKVKIDEDSVHGNYEKTFEFVENNLLNVDVDVESVAKCLQMLRELGNKQVKEHNKRQVTEKVYGYYEKALQNKNTQTGKSKLWEEYQSLAKEDFLVNETGYGLVRVSQFNNGGELQTSAEIKTLLKQLNNVDATIETSAKGGGKGGRRL